MTELRLRSVSCYGFLTVTIPPLPTDAAPPSLQARKQRFVGDSIWDAAIDLFLQKGFDETTVDDIALAAGVSRRSFFRYFASKNDLLAHGMVSYASILTDAIAACPRSFTLPEVFRATVLQTALQQSAHPRTRKIMRVVTTYPAAREAQLSRYAEVQDKLAAAYAGRAGKRQKGDITPGILAALTLAVLSATFRSWYETNPKDISTTVDQVLSTLKTLV
jgi:AcrR family transcriptional regulator